MEHGGSLVATVAVSLALAYAGGIAAHALRLPALIGYVIAGLAVGPFTPGFVADHHLVTGLAEIGVALLLFGVGIHFSLKDLVGVWQVVVPGALLQVALSSAIGFGVGRGLLGWASAPALVLGLSLAIGSTAVATRALAQRQSLAAPEGKIAVGWLVVQDLVVVIALVLLPTASHLEAGDGPEILVALGRKLLEISGFLAVVLLVGRKLIPWALAWTAKDGSRELFRLAVIVVAIGVAYASAQLTGASLALGAFFAGVVLAETDVSHQAVAESVPVQQIFTILFFVSVGMLFDPTVLAQEPLTVLALVVTILLGTGAVTLILLLAFRTSLAVAAPVAAALAQIGEFSFILTGLAVREGVLGADGRDVVLAAALLTIVANPFVIRGADAVASRLTLSSNFRRWTDRGKETKARADAPYLTGHAIIVGHGRVGSVVASALARQGLQYVVVEQEMRLAHELRREGVPVIYGDAGWPEVLGAARPETARLIVIAVPEHGNVRRIVQTARELNPELRVIVRTHSDAEATWLGTQSVDHIVMSERRTAMDIAEHALRTYEETVPASRKPARDNQIVPFSRP